MIRPSLLLATLGSTAAIGAAELSTDYTKERVVSLEVTLRLEMETVESRFLRDGEEVGGRGGGGGGGSSEERRLVLRDRVMAHEDGTPTRVRRTFATAEGEGTRAMREEELEVPLESPFDGLVLELVEEDGERDYEVLEGDAPDDEHLEPLQLALFLDALLPPDADAETGDSWSLDAEAVRRALLLDMQPHLFPPPVREEGAGGGGGRGGGGRGRGGFGGGGSMGLLATAEFSGDAELLATDEEGDDGPLARIGFEVEAEGEIEQEGGDRGGEGESTYTVVLEGELVFSMKTRRPLSLEVEGKLERVTDRTFDRGDSSMSMYREEAGTFEMSIEVTESPVEEDE